MALRKRPTGAVVGKRAGARIGSGASPPAGDSREPDLSIKVFSPPCSMLGNAVSYYQIQKNSIFLKSIVNRIPGKTLTDKKGFTK
jgi:hypothetical protein